MEDFKKKTIIWSTHEPPRNYLWVKDNNIYEYTNEWKETNIVDKEFVPVEKLMLNKSKLTLKKGKSGNLVATVFPENTTDRTVTWLSSNPEIAEVSASGRVKAKSEGTTMVFAIIGGKYLDCVVTVN